MKPLIVAALVVAVVFFVPLSMAILSSEEVTKEVLICKKNRVPYPGGKVTYNLYTQDNERYIWGDAAYENVTRRNNYEELFLPGKYRLRFADSLFSNTLLDDPVLVSAPVLCG